MPLVMDVPTLGEVPRRTPWPQHTNRISQHGTASARGACASGQERKPGSSSIPSNPTLHHHMMLRSTGLMKALIGTNKEYALRQDIVPKRPPSPRHRQDRRQLMYPQHDVVKAHVEAHMDAVAEEARHHRIKRAIGQGPSGPGSIRSMIARILVLSGARIYGATPTVIGNRVVLLGTSRDNDRQVAA